MVAVRDAETRENCAERLGRWQRVASTDAVWAHRGGKVAFEVDEVCARNVSCAVGPNPEFGLGELEAGVEYADLGQVCSQPLRGNERRSHRR
jgi:hypothetical protein